MKKIYVIFLILVLTGCSLKRATTSVTADIVTDGMKAVEAESDLWIAKESILPMVKILEVFKEGDPENEVFLALMAKVYGNVAFGFFEPRYIEAKSENEKGVWRDRIERYYKKGYEDGFQALSSMLGSGMKGTLADIKKTINQADEDRFQTLFWTAFDMGRYIDLNRNDVILIAKLPVVESMIDRIIEVERDFIFGSALAFKASLMASRPKMLGGNPDRAREIFEEAISIADGSYLMTKVMFAERYAIPQKKFDLARSLLKDVVSSDPMLIPEQALANRLAIERAEILLQHALN